MITVIVPYYNAAPFLARCCQSLTENAGDFEFIMVNDNSQDNGAQIVAEFAKTDARFVLVDNARNKGVSGARNTGIEQARGEWITFLDADDKLAPEAFAVFSEATRGGRFNIYQFEHWRYYSKLDKMTVKYKNRPGKYDITKMPLCFAMVWNKLYKAEFVRDIRFDETCQYCEDELFNLECLARDNRVYCIDGETTIHYFDNPDSLTKVKGAADLYRQACRLMLFIQRQTNPEIKTAVCLRLSEHWASNIFLDVIGERQEIGGEHGNT